MKSSKDGKILLCMTALVCLAFQACAQSDPLGESASGSTMGSSGDYLSPNMGVGSRGTNPDEGTSGMVQWLDEPVTKDVTESTATATSSPGPGATKSTAATTSATTSPDATTSTTTTTRSTPATEAASTTRSTTTTGKTPGFEVAFAVAGLLAVTFISLRRKR